MASIPKTLDVLYRDKIAESNGLVSRTWGEFFRLVQIALSAYGIEQYFELENNQVSPTNIDGLSFDKSFVSQASVDYLIQRVTDLSEEIETGTFYAAYLPDSEDWVLSNGPSSAGVTLTITSSGQVQYASSDLAGTKTISKLTWRARTMAAKNSLYSQMGGS